MVRCHQCIALSRSPDPRVRPRCTVLGICCDFCRAIANNADQLWKIANVVWKTDQLKLLELKTSGDAELLEAFITELRGRSYVTLEKIMILDRSALQQIVDEDVEKLAQRVRAAVIVSPPCAQSIPIQHTGLQFCHIWPPFHLPWAPFGRHLASFGERPKWAMIIATFIAPFWGPFGTLWDHFGDQSIAIH